MHTLSLFSATKNKHIGPTHGAKPVNGHPASNPKIGPGDSSFWAFFLGDLFSVILAPHLLGGFLVSKNQSGQQELTELIQADGSL
jgi:hypothetical protein